MPFIISEEFMEVIKQTTLHQRVPFNFESDFVKMYFGKDRKRSVNYLEFSQFLHVSERIWILDIYK